MSRRQETAATSKGEQVSGEDRRAEAVTVAWVLCVMATLGADVLGIGGQVVLRLLSRNRELPETVWLLPGLMLFTALVTGLISVILLPLVYRFRRVPPPPAITVAAVAAFIVPLVVSIVSVA